MKVKSVSEVVQSCPTPSDPMDCSLSGSSIHGIFQARVLEWVAIAFSNFAVYNIVNQLYVNLFFFNSGAIDSYELKFTIPAALQ